MNKELFWNLESTFRKRSCDSPPPQGQSGKDCVGNDKQEKECSTSCNIDGGWSNWQEWTVCSASCSQIRARKCNHPEPQNDGKKCSGPETEQMDCSSDFCKRNETFMDSLSDQPALIAGLAVVTVLFLSALAVGMVVFRKVRKNKAKVGHRNCVIFLKIDQNSKFSKSMIFTRVHMIIINITNQL